jgi:hypothetical protein
MTTIRKTLITVLATSAVTVAIGSSAMADDYSSVSALVGDQQAARASGYSSPNAIVGATEAGQSAAGQSAADYSSPTAIVGATEAGQSAGQSAADYSSVNAIVGEREARESGLGLAGVTSAVSSAPSGSSGGFDWGDALIGAGVTVGLALTTALMLGMMRRRTRVEPSV